MRKIFLTVAAIIVSVVPAMGEIQRYGSLTADVPPGWTLEKQGSVFVIKSLTKNASVAVAVNSLGEASLTDIAERLYTQMGGSNLERDSDGDYSFIYTNTSGAVGMAIITDSGEGRYILMSVTGYENEELQGEIDAIVDSLDWDD
ncbi:MAG: hypothetical protein IJG37_03450 [Synergistaceae bacterium]|nr:hypothetical protein [Synergistaceae bacterium]MBQ6971887.1 hypothetical protein [Synergistaceae bacterium]